MIHCFRSITRLTTAPAAFPNLSNGDTYLCAEQGNSFSPWRDELSLLDADTRVWFMAVQNSVRMQVHSYLNDLQNAVRVFGASPTNFTSEINLRDLYETWEREYADVSPAWPEVMARLHEAAVLTSVVEINSKSREAFTYSQNKEAGLSVIAVGGDALSRGLTLKASRSAIS